MPARRQSSKPNGDLRKVEFRFEAPPGIRIGLAGSFNNWDAYAHQMQEDTVGGLYRLVLDLPQGKHEYRFVIGDQWRTDLQNPDTVTNPYGSVNSVVTV